MPALPLHSAPRSCRQAGDVTQTFTCDRDDCQLSTVSCGTYCDHAEHGMRHVERVPPVVVRHVAVVLLDAEQPPTQHLREQTTLGWLNTGVEGESYLVGDRELFGEVEIMEHAQTQTQRAVVVEQTVVEEVIVNIHNATRLQRSL